MRSDFDTLFGRMMSGWLTPFDDDLESIRMWDFNISEQDNEIAVRAELPGFEDNEIDVQINNNMLTIRAEKEEQDEKHSEYRNFYRSIPLPTGIDTDNVQARYHNGVLELHIPRSEAAQPKRIKIEGQQANEGSPKSTHQKQGQSEASSQGSGSKFGDKGKK